MIVERALFFSLLSFNTTYLSNYGALILIAITNPEFISAQAVPKSQTLEQLNGPNCSEQNTHGKALESIKYLYCKATLD